MRIPNTKCSVCDKPLYRRPSDLKYQSICSSLCRRERSLKICFQCGEKFIPDKKTSRYCSRGCSNSSRKGSSYSKKNYTNKSQEKLAQLKNKFNFTTCMVKGCKYSTTFDIHRLKPGREGGEYIIGNMFAICPNHHAEIERGYVYVRKIDDSTLECLPSVTVSGLENQSGG